MLLIRRAHLEQAANVGTQVTMTSGEVKVKPGPRQPSDDRGNIFFIWFQSKHGLHQDVLILVVRVQSYAEEKGFTRAIMHAAHL